MAKEETRRKRKNEKIRKWMEKHVGGFDKIEMNYTGVEYDRKANDVKCFLCGFVLTKLHRHMMNQHIE